GAPRLRQADGDGLLAALHPPAGAAAFQRAALALVHRAFDLRSGFTSVLGHTTSSEDLIQPLLLPYAPGSAHPLYVVSAAAGCAASPRRAPESGSAAHRRAESRDSRSASAPAPR